MKTVLAVLFVAVGLAIGSGLYLYRAGSTQSPTGAIEISTDAQPAPLPQAPPEAQPKTAAPFVRDPKLSRLVDRKAENRVTADIGARIPEANKEDFPALISVVMDSTDEDTARHETVELLKRSKCPDLPVVLTKVLDNPAEGPRFRAFAMQHLGGLAADAPESSDTRQKLVAKMQTCLDDKHFTVRCQSLQNLCRLKDPKGAATAVKWLADYKPCCIGADGKPADADFERASILNQAIRCAKDLDLKDQISTIRKYATDSNEVVRIAALVVLSEWGDQDCRAACEDAANSKSVRLQRCGQAALKRLDAAKASD